MSEHVEEDREAEGWLEAEAYASDCPPSERGATMDDFMSGWRTADRTRQESSPADELFPGTLAALGGLTIRVRWRCGFCTYPFPADEGDPNKSKHARCTICGGEDDWEVSSE